MKPKLKTMAVEYWDCGNPAHRHRTEAVAAACAKKQEERAERAKTARPKRTAEEYAAALKMRREGASYTEVARSFGLSSCMGRSIITRALCREMKAARAVDPFYRLSWWVRNALHNLGFETVDDVRAALLSGRIGRTLNLGDVGKAEIARWLEELDAEAGAARN